MPKPALVDRVRKMLARKRGVSEKKMFGGICFFANGNMIGGVSGGEELIIRVGPDAYEDALELPFARVMDFTGRPMRGFVTVDSHGHDDDDDLKAWLERGLKFARSLPAK